MLNYYLLLKLFFSPPIQKKINEHLPIAASNIFSNSFKNYRISLLGSLFCHFVNWCLHNINLVTLKGDCSVTIFGVQNLYLIFSAIRKFPLMLPHLYLFTRTSCLFHTRRRLLFFSVLCWGSSSKRIQKINLFYSKFSSNNKSALPRLI